MTIPMNDKRFKDAARRLHQSIKSQNNKRAFEFGYQETLEALSQALFSKPFGEARVTELAEKAPSNQSLPFAHQLKSLEAVIEHCDDPKNNTAPQVRLLCNAASGVQVLTLRGRYVEDNLDSPGTNLRVNAEQLAAMNDTYWDRVELGADSLIEACDVDQVVDYAKAMGYFRNRVPLIEMLWASEADQALIMDRSNEFIAGIHALPNPENLSTLERQTLGSNWMSAIKRLSALDIRLKEDPEGEAVHPVSFYAIGAAQQHEIEIDEQGTTAVGWQITADRLHASNWMTLTFRRNIQHTPLNKAL